MPPAGTPFDWARVDVAVPSRSLGLPGISMAGFRQSVPALVDIAMVAHPSVTLIVDLTGGEGLVYDAQRRHRHGSFVAGLLPGPLGARGWRAEVAYTWRRTLASRGRVRVESLADEVGWSRKRLWSCFRRQVGITPKRAAQLVRFDPAAHLLAAGHSAASVAAESGYADQSHLHREVRAITGDTPAAVAAAPWLAIDDVAWPAASRA